MKRVGYVDSQGNPINHEFESKKGLLRFFFVFGTVLPIIIIGFIVYEVVQNNKCNDLYQTIKSATNKYLKENDKLPTVEGESVTVSVSRLYSNNYLSTLRTDNMQCSGSVKTTRYKKEYIYTLNLTSCDTCSNTRYGSWSSELSYKPNKSNIDVVPYYNYYKRQVNVTPWTDYFTPDELKSKKSKYGVKLPKDSDSMPEVPKEASIVDVQKQTTYQYRYKDKQWLWYDIKGDYSDFSSEQPTGFANKDEDAYRYTKWSKYDTNYPEEKDYRDIESTTGYIYYYEKNGKKIYANHKQYTAPEDVDQDVYTETEPDTSEMYRYRDMQWRWYNGQKRDYSGFSSKQPEDYPYCDEETEEETNYSSWSYDSSANSTNEDYRTEEKRVMTKYRYVYEILSASIFENAVSKDKFVNKVKMTVPEFAAEEDYKLEVTYKFKYQKR